MRLLSSVLPGLILFLQHGGIFFRLAPLDLFPLGAKKRKLPCLLIFVFAAARGCVAPAFRQRGAGAALYLAVKPKCAVEAPAGMMLVHPFPSVAKEPGQLRDFKSIVTQLLRARMFPF